jgi:prepilin-type N-terminal cleavage/methylation domain-containing protein
MQRGFTLIELMVSVTIFIIVMTISLGALFSMSAADRKAESVKTIMNNLSFALDSMTRTIRTGSAYGCPTVGTDCNGGTGGSQIVLTAASGQTVSYCLGLSGATTCLGATACTAGNTCSILRRYGTSGNFLQMTAPEVQIANLSFYVLGSVAGDNTQPRVVVTLDGSIDTGDQAPTTFQIQTTATQRLYDQ